MRFFLISLISLFILKKRLPSKSRNVIVLWSVLLAVVLPPAILIGLGRLLASLFGRR